MLMRLFSQDILFFLSIKGNMCLRLAIHYFMYVACYSTSIWAETDWHFEGLNIAYGKPATQGPDTYSERLSSGTIKYYTADLAVDDNTSGRFTDGSCTHTKGSSSTNAYWTVDLQKAYKITGIIIYNRDSNRERLKNFIIYGNGTEVIHNSRGSDEYRQYIIRIPLSDKRSFSSITVQLPANDGHSEKGIYYLTLCEVEIYAAVCGYIIISNGEMKPNQISFEVNTEALIVCNEGFEPAMQTITCSNNKEWTYFKPCSRVYFAYPGKPLNGDYLKKHLHGLATYLPSSLPYGSIITVRCDLGYQSENNKSRTCQHDGTWSGEAPLCKKVQCSFPEGVTDGEYQLQNGSLYNSGSSYYNTTVQVLCNTGYRIVGSKERTCNANQKWSGETKCILVTCSLPRTPDGGFYGIKASNGSFTPYIKTMSNYSNEIHAICPKGYFLNSTSSVRRCLETGLWSGEHGNCVLVTCRQPEEIIDGFYNYTKELLSERAPYNTILTAVCDKNFELVNPENGKRRCTETGVWDKEPAFCGMLCHVPNVTNGQFLNLMTSKFKIGTSLHFTCDPGFTPAKSKNDITCLKTKRWSKTPECKAIQKTLTAAEIGGISGAVLLVVVTISGLVIYLVQRRRKRSSKHQDESMTYNNLRKKQDGLSDNAYAEINAMELERSGSLKDETRTGRENEVYCNSSIEM